MKIGDKVVYVARQSGKTFEICGEVVGFEEVEWTRSGIEVAVEFTDTTTNERWIQHIDPTRLEVISEQKCS